MNLIGKYYKDKDGGYIKIVRKAYLVNAYLFLKAKIAYDKGEFGKEYSYISLNDSRWVTWEELKDKLKDCEEVKLPKRLKSFRPKQYNDWYLAELLLYRDWWESEESNEVPKKDLLLHKGRKIK